jgi:hypothetical protein
MKGKMTCPPGKNVSAKLRISFLKILIYVLAGGLALAGVAFSLLLVVGLGVQLKRRKLTAMSRQCISVSWLLDLRFGQSFGPEDLAPPKLRAWRWFKLRKQLKVGSLARGEALSEAEAVYLIDNGLATVRRPT